MVPNGEEHRDSGPAKNLLREKRNIRHYFGTNFA